jgi:hypothetical protein
MQEEPKPEDVEANGAPFAEYILLFRQWRGPTRLFDKRTLPSSPIMLGIIIVIIRGLIILSI